MYRRSCTRWIANAYCREFRVDLCISLVPCHPLCGHKIMNPLPACISIIAFYRHAIFHFLARRAKWNAIPPQSCKMSAIINIMIPKTRNNGIPIVRISASEFKIPNLHSALIVRFYIDVAKLPAS